MKSRAKLKQKAQRKTCGTKPEGLVSPDESRVSVLLGFFVPREGTGDREVDRNSE
jgi:hypothetical protein